MQGFLLVRCALLSAMLASTSAFSLCPSAPVRGVPPQRPKSLCRLRGVFSETRRVSLRMVDGGDGDKGGENQEESPAERLLRLSMQGRAPIGIEDSIEGIPQVTNTSVDSRLSVTPPTTPLSPHPDGVSPYRRATARMSQTQDEASTIAWA